MYILNVVLRDTNECNVSEDDVVDRVKWRRKVRKTDPIMWNT